jgi:hypothetical protein
MTNTDTLSHTIDKRTKNVIFINILSDHQNKIDRKGDSKLFIKEFFSEAPLLKELNGYEIVSKYYPVAKLLNLSTCKNEGRLVFEYEESIGSNKGLLLDIFNGADTANSFADILNMYLSVFDKTLEKTAASAADTFFKDRALKLKEKYPTLYSAKEPIKIKFNNSDISFKFSQIVDEVVSYFNDDTHNTLWSIVSQGDPSDVNLGIKPILLDYLCGGRVPLMAEFASLVWEQVAQSVVLAPTYNPKTYAEHDLVYKQTPTISIQDNHLKFAPSKDRIRFLNEYTKRIMVPIIKKINYPDWYEDFKHFIAMRIIGVFDINNFSTEHRLLALGYLGLFYNKWNPKTPLELIELIAK